MKKTTFVALLLLFNNCLASDSFDASVQVIESEWASIYYDSNNPNKLASFDTLLAKAEQLSKQYPKSSEALFWQAVIMATAAEHQDGFTALHSVNRAKALLEGAIKINPNTANGSAYVTLGTLYYMMPKWPIAFGDNDKAEEMYKQALKINPNGIDANYFYGDFLLSKNQAKTALRYLEKAISIPSRKERLFADNQMKLEAKELIVNSKSRRLNGIKNAFLSLFNSASLK